MCTSRLKDIANNTNLLYV